MALHCKTVARMKAVREQELLLSDCGLPAGLQGRLLAESDCGRLQSSRSRRGRDGVDVARSQGPKRGF